MTTVTPDRAVLDNPIWHFGSYRLVTWSPLLVPEALPDVRSTRTHRW